jgi:hypothetical protein
MSDNDNGLIVIHTCLALMRELEDSLLSSQVALLARDTVGTEGCTREQVRLWRQWRALMANPISSGTMSVPGKYPPEITPGDPELAGQLCAAVLRIQHLARVQLALLRRSQQFLNVLANWMADPETPYGPPPAAGGAVHVAPHAHQGF